jgi:uncharacterized membrane protein
LSKWIISIFFTAALLILSGNRVYAEEIKVSTDIINAEITKNGTMLVSEEISFNISGKYNGVYKDISYDKASGIFDITVQEINGSTVAYKKVSLANNGDREVYTVTKDANNSVRVKIYSPSSNELKTFKIEYRIPGVVRKYNDAGELYWKFIGKENETSIQNLQINVKLPQGANKDDIKAFGQGPSNGKWVITNDRTINFSAANLSPSKYVEVRVLFPKGLLSEMKESSSENRFQQIMNEEIRKANKDKEIIKVLGYVSSLIIIINFILAPFILLKFKKPQGLDDLLAARNIYNYNPTILAYNARRNLSNNDLLAAILELVRKGYLSIEAMDEWEEADKNWSKSFKNYKITKLKEKDNSLYGHERYLIHWIIDKIGDRNSVTLVDIKEYGKRMPKEFASEFNLWKGEIHLNYKGMNLANKKAEIVQGLVIFVEILFAAASVGFLIRGSKYGMVSLVMSALSFTAAVLINTRTLEGNIQFALWKQIKSKLSSLKLKDMDQLINDAAQGEVYLIYAVAMNLRESLISKIKPYSNSNSNCYDSNFWMMYYILDDKDSGFNNSFDSSFEDTGYSGDFSSGDSGGGGSSGGGGGAGGF